MGKAVVDGKDERPAAGQVVAAEAVGSAQPQVVAIGQQAVEEVGGQAVGGGVQPLGSAAQVYGGQPGSRGQPQLVAVADDLAGVQQLVVGQKTELPPAQQLLPPAVIGVQLPAFNAVKAVVGRVVVQAVGVAHVLAQGEKALLSGRKVLHIFIAHQPQPPLAVFEQVVAGLKVGSPGQGLAGEKVQLVAPCIVGHQLGPLLVVGTKPVAAVAAADGRIQAVGLRKSLQAGVGLRPLPTRQPAVAGLVEGQHAAAGQLQQVAAGKGDGRGLFVGKGLTELGADGAAARYELEQPLL